jgi:hypothetical protein
MKTRINQIAACVVVLIAIALFAAPRQSEAAFGGSAQPPVGKQCTVQFRRGDALGGGANLPVSPMTSSINGAETAISGKLVSVSETWLVVESANESLMWIPKASILLVHVAKQ